MPIYDWHLYSVSVTNDLTPYPEPVLVWSWPPDDSMDDTPNPVLAALEPVLAFCGLCQNFNNVLKTAKGCTNDYSEVDSVLETSCCDSLCKLLKNILSSESGTDKKLYSKSGKYTSLGTQTANLNTHFETVLSHHVSARTEINNVHSSIRDHVLHIWVCHSRLLPWNSRPHV